MMINYLQFEKADVQPEHPSTMGQGRQSHYFPRSMSGPSGVVMYKGYAGLGGEVRA